MKSLINKRTRWTKNTRPQPTRPKLILVVSKSCNQCSALVINGVFCHEHGCPNEHKKFDSDSGEWKSVIKCRECGCDVEEGETCCEY